jgi:6-hydroxytryprostatin B O-methyltransferase
MAATSGLFTILPLERVAHSAASLLLATSLEFNAWATCVTQYQFDASSKLTLANERWGRSDEMKHSPFSMAFGTDLTFPEYLGQNPLMARTMGQFLSATQMVDANNPRHLVAGYDWKALGAATIVDVSCNVEFVLTFVRSSK